MNRRDPTHTPEPWPKTRPGLVAHARDLGFAPPPAALLRLPEAGRKARWAWSSADGRQQLAGFGVAARVRSAGASRFTDARVRIRAITERCRGSAEDLRWLGGFGFWDEDGAGLWSGFPGLCFVLPEVLLELDERGARLRVIGPAELAQALPGRADALARALEAHSPARGPGPRASLAPIDGSAGRAAGDGDRDVAGIEASVARVVAAIRAGRAEKVVLAVARETWLPEAPDPLAVLERLRATQMDCYPFLMAPTPEAAFLGATPERLLSLRAGQLETMALAGSAPRGAAEVEDAALGAALLESVKDRQEHALVVEAIRRALEALGVKDLALPAVPRLRRLATIQHLETPVSARLDGDADILALAARLHPTPALGGSPRAEALALIRELEDARPGRGWYAGGVGWLDGRGNGDLSVAIRSVLLRGRLATCIAGAGLVASSDPAAEAREIEMKLRVARAAL